MGGYFLRPEISSPMSVSRICLSLLEAVVVGGLRALRRFSTSSKLGGNTVPVKVTLTHRGAPRRLEPNQPFEIVLQSKAAVSESLEP